MEADSIEENEKRKVNFREKARKSVIALKF